MKGVRHRGFLRSAFLLGFGLWLVSPPPAPARAAETFRDPAERARVTVLDNGLTVLTLEDHTTPVVSFQLWVKVGSGDEARWTGLAHLFEHMMFRGSKNLPPEAMQRILESRGGRVNAFTSRDQTVYFEDVTAETLPLVIQLEAERLRNLDLSASSLKSERQVVLEERRLRTENDPEGQAYLNLMALTFQAHPYRVPVIGWRSDVEEVGLAQCRHFFQEYYAANNIVVAIAGDIDTKVTLGDIRAQLGKLRRSPEIERNPTVEPEQRGERRAVVHFDVKAPILAMAWHAPKTGSPDGPALDVLGEILSDGRSSRLYEALVYGRPLALSASAYYWEFLHAGLFYAEATARPGVDVDRVEKIFREQIARVRTRPVTPRELSKAKRSLEVSLLARLASAHDLASRMGRDWVAFGRIRPLDERLRKIRAVTAADVQRVARKYLVDRALSVVQVVPPPEAAE